MAQGKSQGKSITCALPSTKSSAISNWKTHKLTWEYISPPGKDFKALNKAAIQSGLTTAPEQQHYRATHDIREKRKVQEEKEKLTFPDDMVFGVSTRLVHTTRYH